MATAVQSKIAGLDRNDHVGSCPQGTERQQTNRRRAIDYHVIKFLPEIVEYVFQVTLAIRYSSHLLVIRTEVNTSRRQFKTLTDLPEDFRDLVHEEHEQALEEHEDTQALISDTKQSVEETKATVQEIHEAIIK